MHCSPICPPEEWPPLVCPMGHDGWPHPFVGGATHQLNPLKPHLQRISKITVCSRKPGKVEMHPAGGLCGLCLRCAHLIRLESLPWSVKDTKGKSFTRYLACSSCASFLWVKPEEKAQQESPRMMLRAPPLPRAQRFAQRFSPPTLRCSPNHVADTKLPRPGSMQLRLKRQQFQQFRTWLSRFH